MTDQEISEIASRVLKERFPDAGLIAAEAKSDLDYEGTPILTIMARFQHRPLIPDASSSAIHELRTELLRRGEDRFVFLSNEYRDQPEEQEEDVG
jgi:hypothetical protein